jgi:hypothetical protein
VDSLSLQFLGSLTGKGQGVAGNPGIRRVLNGRTFNIGLGLTGTTVATYANNGADQTHTLSVTGTTVATTTLDLRSFTNVVNEPTQAISKLRLIYVKHAPTSSAPAIHVGNSGANALIVQGCMGTTPIQLPPNGQFVLALPSLAGETVDATHKDIKVAITGTSAGTGTVSAAFTIGWWGE